jgi:uncharacterized protein (TIGR03435 family)
MTRRLSVATGLVLALAIVLAVGPRPSAQNFNLPPGARMEAPDPNIPLYFEAASVKQNKEGGPGSRINRAPGGRFSTGNVLVSQLITFAYQLQGYQLVGDLPDWAKNDRWDIVAKFDGDPPAVNTAAGADHMMLAMRTLLADRYKLKFRREKREMDIYQLVMARPGGKPGPAMKPNDECRPGAVAAGAPAPGTQPQGPRLRADGSAIRCGYGSPRPGVFRLDGQEMAQFALGIAGRVGRQVIDRTGLAGDWSFEMTFAPPAGGPPPPPGVELPPVDPGAPDLFTAIQEQLGLKLEATKGPVDVFVVESIARPTED